MHGFRDFLRDGTAAAPFMYQGSEAWAPSGDPAHTAFEPLAESGTGLRTWGPGVVSGAEPGWRDPPPPEHSALVCRHPVFKGRNVLRRSAKGVIL